MSTKPMGTGQRVYGERMSAETLNEILPLLKPYHTTPPQIKEAYYGSKYYTLIIEEDDGLYQETYQYISNEFTRNFRAKITEERYALKKLVYIIPCAVSFLATFLYGKSNFLLTLGGILIGSYFFFKALSR